MPAWRLGVRFVSTSGVRERRESRIDSPGGLDPMSGESS